MHSELPSNRLNRLYQCLSGNTIDPSSPIYKFPMIDCLSVVKVVSFKMGEGVNLTWFI
jgi:hypothetical protein